MATALSSDGPQTASAVLDAARTRRRTADLAEAELLELAVSWAAQHSAESITESDFDFTEQAIPVAGVGAPEVAEFCVHEFAAVLGLSTDSGRLYVGQAVELAYRLPRVWARVVADEVVSWKARRIAQATIFLSQAGAAFVDEMVAPYAHRIGVAQLDRVIEEAKTRFDPEAAEADRARAADGRCFDVRTDQTTLNGTAHVNGVLDLADAIDLDTAVAQGAAELGRLGCDESLDVRRSLAAGELARRQLAFDLNGPAQDTPATPDPSSAAPDAGPTPARRAPRQVVLHVHISAEALKTQGLARVENTRWFVSSDQVRDWCNNPDTQVVVKPVIDLDDFHRVDSYEIPDRLREQAILINPHCVFPWCTRPSRGCDIDHVIPYDAGGETATDNLAPLCRRHHRTKTHGRWHYARLEAGSFLWTSPHGLKFLTDHRGTLSVTPDPDDEPNELAGDGTDPPEP